MGSHIVTCHPAEVTFPPLSQPIMARTRFSDPRGMQGCVDLVGMVTYQCGIPARRWSPIPVLTGLNVEQLRSYDERRYTTALNRPSVGRNSSHLVLFAVPANDAAQYYSRLRARATHGCDLRRAFTHRRTRQKVR